MKGSLCSVLIASVLFCSCREEVICPTACFATNDSTSILAYDTVWFVNCSAGYDSILLDFGDNRYSTKDTSYHIYPSPGIYHVRLNAVKEDCINIAEKTISVSGTVPSMIYGTYAGNCVDTVVLSPCNSCSDPFSFMVEGFFNGYNVAATLEGVSFTLTNYYPPLTLSGFFSDDLQTVTILAGIGTIYIPDYVPGDSCLFTGTRQ